MTYYVNSNSYPYSSVVYIEATFSSGRTYTGSGVVVGQNDVLTASHVIYSATDGGLATEINVYPGRDGSSTPYGSFSADFVNYYPVGNDGDGLLSQSESQYDLALLGFDEQIGNSTGWFAINPNATSGYYYITGYPGVYSDFNGPRLTQDFGYAYTDWYYTNWNHSGIEVNSGNSGGPIWYYVNGQPYVVGVVSTDGWSPDVRGYYDEIVSWIDGNDTLIGGGATDTTIIGTSNDELVSGSGSDDIISAGAGSDTLRAGAGDDIAYGNTEADVLSGGTGNDTLYGGQNNGPASTGVGNASDGTSKQREGVEYISGGSGDDVIYGNYGTDMLFGGAGNDKLFGGQDSDTLLGGSGNDTLYGNRGDDTLVGGSGSDTFVIQTNTISTATVEDFSVGIDFLQANSPRTIVSDSSSGALIEFTNGSSVTLIGVSSSSVVDAIFI
jgi:Ca2+-binding RTX toxin-like protein